MKNIGVLISGGGTNLQALIDAQGNILKSGRIVCVCSNNADAYGLERANRLKLYAKRLTAAVTAMNLAAVFVNI